MTYWVVKDDRDQYFRRIFSNDYGGDCEFAIKRSRAQEFRSPSYATEIIGMIGRVHDAELRVVKVVRK